MARDSHFFVCNKKLSDLAQIFKKSFLRGICSIRGKFLKLTESDNFLLHTKKLVSLAIHEMVNLDTF